MKRECLLDTGPLVALLDRNDQFNRWTTDQLARITPPLLTCEPVITEACFLMKRIGIDPAEVVALVARGDIGIDFELAKHLARVESLLIKYRDLPISLADACLVTMSELHRDSEVFTLDSDFKVYRRSDRRRIPLRAPH